MEETKPDSAGTGGAWFTRPAVSDALMKATYVAGGAGIALGIYGLISGGGIKGLHWAIALMVGAVGLLSLVRHSVFHVSDARRSGVESDPFYMIELGFANGAIGLLALIAFFGNWGAAAEVALTLTYAVYLGLALILFLYRMKAQGVDAGKVFGACMWALQVAFMLYLGIAAAVAARL
ncbi:MAG: DUF6790 family protein [Candidatus Geothermincolia bacterium]